MCLIFNLATQRKILTLFRMSSPASFSPPEQDLGHGQGARLGSPWCSGPRAAQAPATKTQGPHPSWGMVLTPSFKCLTLWRFCRDPGETCGIPAGWEKGAVPPRHAAFLLDHLGASRSPQRSSHPFWGFWCVNSYPPWLNLRRWDPPGSFVRVPCGGKPQTCLLWISWLPDFCSIFQLLSRIQEICLVFSLVSGLLSGQPPSCGWGTPYVFPQLHHSLAFSNQRILLAHQNWANRFQMSVWSLELRGNLRVLGFLSPWRSECPGCSVGEANQVWLAGLQIKCAQLHVNFR